MEANSPTRPVVRIEMAVPVRGVPRAALRRSIHRVLREEGRQQADITVIVIDDPCIRRLNRTYRQMDRATDVLSFCMETGEDADRPLLGEIYISIDRVREQALRFQVREDEEWRRLVVHGCLHLLGYDHHKTAERTVMRGKEALYLSARQPIQP